MQITYCLNTSKLQILSQTHLYTIKKVQTLMVFYFMGSIYNLGYTYDEKKVAFF